MTESELGTHSLLYPENAVTGIFTTEWPPTWRRRYHILPRPQSLWMMAVYWYQWTIFTDHPYKLKKGLHIANFFCHDAGTNEIRQTDRPGINLGISYNRTKSKRLITSVVSSRRIKARKTKKNYWFSYPGEPRQTRKNTPIQKRILRELQGPYRTWRPLILQKDPEISGKVSRKTSTGKTPLWLLKIRRK